MKFIIAFLLVSLTLVYSQDRSCTGENNCPSGQRCFNGKCQVKLTCKTVSCIKGTECLNNPIRCLKTCKNDSNCTEKETCKRGHCENRLTCSTVKCSAKCREYPIRCVEPCAANNKCPTGQNCIEGYCEKPSY